MSCPTRRRWAALFHTRDLQNQQTGAGSNAALPFQEKYKRLEIVLKAESVKKEKEDRSRLPDPPKTAQEIWQQSVIGDYMARFKVCGSTGGRVW